MAGYESAAIKTREALIVYNLVNVYIKPCLLDVYTNMASSNKMHMVLSHDDSIYRK